MKKDTAILVVEDTPGSPALLVSVLSEEGYRVQSVHSGELALAAAVATPPDLILLDIRMAGLSGFDVCRQLKANVATQHIPVIFLSALADVADWAEGLRLGAVDYIKKPFRQDELLMRVKTQLTLHQNEVLLQDQGVELAHANCQLQTEMSERKRGEVEQSKLLEQADQSRRLASSNQKAQECTEKSLRASELRYRRLFESAKDGILILDAETKKIIDVNPFLIELTGYGYENFLGKHLWEIGPLKDAAASKASFKELMTKEYVRYDDLPLTTRDGELLEVEFISNVYQQDNQRVIQCNIRDITGRVILEKRARLAAQVMTALNRNNDIPKLVGHILGKIQESTQIEAVAIRLREGDDFPYFETRGFGQEFVRSEQNLCARNGEGELLCDTTGRPVLECMCGNVLCERTDPALPFFTKGGSFWTNSTTALLATTTQAERQANTQNRCNEEGYESVALIPLRSADEIIGLLQFNDHQLNRLSLAMIEFYEQLGASIGIAVKRKQTQEAVMRLARFPDENPSPVLRFDTEGYVLYHNKASQPILDLWNCCGGQRIPQEWLERSQTALATQDSICLEVNCNSRLYMLVLVPLPTLQYVNVYGMDITEQREVEARLRQSEKMQAIGLLAGGVAHEFNNQLAVINGFSELLLRKDLVRNSKTIANGIDQILNAGQRASELTASLLAYSRAEAIATKVVSLNCIIQEMKNLLQSTIGEDIQLEFVLDADLWRVEVDPKQISDVILNLTGNARDALPVGGHVKVETCNVSFPEQGVANRKGLAIGDYVHLSVRDNGVGMDETTREKVFEPFFTTKPIGKGTGLGLSMVYGVIQKARGAIQVESVVGRGTTMSLYLPRVISEGEVEELNVANPPEELPGGNETILVVDDEEGIRNLVSIALTDIGYDVLVADCAREGMKCMEEKGPYVSLVITDVVMPGMHGMEFLDELRKKFPEIKAIYMSGYSNELVEQRVGHGAMITTLRKPISLLDLAQAVRTLLDE